MIGTKEQVEQELREQIRTLKTELQAIKNASKTPMVEIGKDWSLTQMSPVKQFAQMLKRTSELTEMLAGLEQRLYNITAFDR